MRANQNKCAGVALAISTAALVFVVALNASSVGRFSGMSPSQWVSSYSLSPTSSSSPFISGTSGRRFEMKRSRSYTGSSKSRFSSSTDQVVAAPPADGCKSETWVVITTVNPPTKTIQVRVTPFRLPVPLACTSRSGGGN